MTLVPTPGFLGRPVPMGPRTPGTAEMNVPSPRAPAWWGRGGAQQSPAKLHVSPTRSPSSWTALASARGQLPSLGLSSLSCPPVTSGQASGDRGPESQLRELENVSPSP